jgi:RimJ/RimL family protein N-acetyltransferase
MAIAQAHSPAHVSLRAASPRDAELLLHWRSEPTVRRHQPLNDLSASQLRADVAGQRMADLYRGRGEKFQWIVEASGEPVGWITLVVSNWEHGLAEVGYALTTAWQGRGVMTRALSRLLDDLFAHTSLERVEARCAVDNLGSRRVLEKSGFLREGHLRSYFRLHGERVDNLLYALLRGDWRRRGEG